MLFYVYLKPYIGRGPLWQAVANDPSCDTYWWTNLLYINNFVGANAVSRNFFMDGWMDEWMKDGWMNEWLMDGWNECVDEWMKDGWMNECWVDGWMVEGTNEWRDEQVIVTLNFKKLKIEWKTEKKKDEKWKEEGKKHCNIISKFVLGKPDKWYKKRRNERKGKDISPYHRSLQLQRAVDKTLIDVVEMED